MEQQQNHKLTLKQENFCLSYIETGNASEAYRRAYQAENMEATTINRRAVDLLNNGKIAARLEVLRNPVIEKAQVTLERHLQDLLDLRDKAAQEGRYSAAIQAEIARGKAAGLYSEKVEISGKDGKGIEVKSGLTHFYGGVLPTPAEAYRLLINEN